MVKQRIEKQQVEAECALAGARAYQYWIGYLTSLVDEPDYDEAVTGNLSFDSDMSGSGMSCYDFIGDDGRKFSFCASGHLRSQVESGRATLWIATDSSGKISVQKAEML